MKNSNVLIFRLVVSGFLIIIGIILIPISISISSRYWSLAPYITMLAYLAIGLGIFLVIFSSIKLHVNRKRQMKLNSITQSDVIKMFECPQCGTIGATFFIKLIKDQILIKQRCPTHGARLFRLPMRLKDPSMPYFRDTIFRCFKCGQAVAVDHMRFEGPWTLIKLSCPTHGNRLPYHKFWSDIYEQIAKEVTTVPQPTQQQPIPSEKVNFCPNCGEKFTSADQSVCLRCGSER